MNPYIQTQQIKSAINSSMNTITNEVKSIQSSIKLIHKVKAVKSSVSSIGDIYTVGKGLGYDIPSKLGMQFIPISTNSLSFKPSKLGMQFIPQAYGQSNK